MKKKTTNNFRADIGIGSRKWVRKYRNKLEIYSGIGRGRGRRAGGVSTSWLRNANFTTRQKLGGHMIWSQQLLNEKALGRLMTGENVDGRGGERKEEGWLDLREDRDTQRWWMFTAAMMYARYLTWVCRWTWWKVLGLLKEGMQSWLAAPFWI